MSLIRNAIHTPDLTQTKGILTVDSSRKNSDRDLAQNSSPHHSRPRVDLSTAFARLVNIPEVQKPGLELLDERRGNGERHEHGEESRLHIDLAIAQAPERKAVEQAGNDVEHEHTNHVLRISPHGDKAAMYNGIHLRSQRHGVLPIVLAMVVRGAATVRDDVLDLAAELLVLG